MSPAATKPLATVDSPRFPGHQMTRSRKSLFFQAEDGIRDLTVTGVQTCALPISHDSEEPHMQAVTTIGLDIAKSVFQIHGVDAAGNVIVRRQLKRRYVLPFFQRLPPCLIGIEACASSHHWSRELKALGHTVRLMPAAYVKPYVKRQKNDAADAEAICEAVTRANMRFVATKTLEQQSCLMLHRTRHLFIRQQTAVINAIRAHLAEFGIVAPVGRNGVEDLLNIVADCGDKRLPDVARACIAALGAQLRMLKALDPPPLKWSDLRYVFDIQEDCNGKEALQARRDRREAAPGRCSGLAGPGHDGGDPADRL